jgi:hypothetical protein
MAVMLKDQWKAYFEALKSRFHKDESIISLHQHLLSLEKPAAPVITTTMLSRVRSFFIWF